ncbi:PREDICTED: putative integrase/recombinase HI_1414 [Cyphomyrmex costatus]|uniref:putative integrase/recombinase HI_1414 n=1 Tax=Cyphomyrmex costatus TaxID=456900 RepID=UPI0008521E27|nr:PREDICTED: putative integrase/recombinase HI_1414 [Cyphomyrmex costatus]
MASIKPHLNGYRVQLYTLADACARWRREEAGKRAGGKWERVRLLRFERDDWLAKRRLEALEPSDFSNWRDARLNKVKPASVAREMNILRAVLELARKEWGWLRTNPMQDVRWPKCPRGRARRVSAEEVDALSKAFGVADELRADTAIERIGLAFLFALETGMRSGEICALTWPDIHQCDRYVTVKKSKNGDSRDVPLTPRAVEILDALPIKSGAAFDLDDKTRDVLFRRVRDKTPHRDVHFHDARSEAIWRLSKKLDILELARVIGHRDVKSLMIYFRADASELARRFG